MIRDKSLSAPRSLKGGEPLRLVWADTDEAVGTRPAAKLFVADDGGPLRTIIGGNHSHWVGEEHSVKTGLSNCYDGPTERAMIIESSLRANVVDFRTQAGKLRLMAGTSITEWIIDHLRQIRVPGGYLVEAIECKPGLSHVCSPEDRLRYGAIKRVVEGLGWKFRLIYLKDALGSGERQINFGNIYARQTVRLEESEVAAFEKLVATSPVTTFGALKAALSHDRHRSTALAQRLICSGRVDFDLDRVLFDEAPVRLLPERPFPSLIRF